MHKNILTAEGTPNITTAIASIPVTSVQNTNLFQSDRGNCTHEQSSCKSNIF